MNGAVTVAPVGDAETGRVLMLHDFPGGGVLIGAEKGLFLAREVNGNGHRGARRRCRHRTGAHDARFPGRRGADRG